MGRLKICLCQIQLSPLGLVPKKGSNDYRVIHHLSFPSGTSINDSIPQELKTVSYQTVDDASKLLLRFGKGALKAKSDIEHAYKSIPVHPDDYELLGFKIADQFYFDRTLPMGLSYSCQLFEKFSSAIQWILSEKIGVKGCVHILDDFLFLGSPNTVECKQALFAFHEIAKSLGIPIKEEKTVHPTTALTFLGLELDSNAMEIRLPREKIRTNKNGVTPYVKS